MNRFLRETWELFYWAMFCPSKLQQRMNEWSPAEEEEGKRQDTKSPEILLNRFNSRFAAQYCLLLFCLTLPLIINIAINHQAIDWLQIPLVLLTAYSVGSLLLSLLLGLSVPLIGFIVYRQEPNFWLMGLNETLEILPPLSQIAVGIATWIILVLITYTTTLVFLRLDCLYLSRNLLFIGKKVSILLGSWLATRNWLFVLLVGGISFLWFWFSVGESQLKTAQEIQTKAFPFGEVLAMVFFVALFVAFAVGGIVWGVVWGFVGGVVGIVMGFGVGRVVEIVVTGVVGSLIRVVLVGVVEIVVAGIMAGVMAGFTNLSLLVCILVALSLAPAQEKWLGIITAAILTILSLENLGFHALLTIPFTLVAYYRLLPDYLLLTPISLLLNWFRLSPLQSLKRLPPYTSELLWLPLPNHDRILADAFRTDVSAAMETFQKMQTLPLFGFQQTIKQALPQIITDQLSNIHNFDQIISITKPEHSLFPLLIPTFYQSDSEAEITPQPTASPYLKPEISILFPRLQAIARDVEAALEASNAALRERGLERILNKLGLLSTQLSGLGLKPSAIKRWQPVITRWQRVIELELEEQKKQAQGEVLNPFQYGNPVRLQQKDLFKGRQAFADDIVRRILNRDRPTLVLYGPRRCGKTSFLYNLPRLFPSDLLPVFLDLQSAAITTSEADFCQGLVRAIYKDSRGQGVQLPTPPKRNEFKESPYTVLEDWLDEALEQLGERRILLNWYEFEKIGAAIKEKRLTLRLFDELRHLIQHYDQLAFLFSGVKTLDEIGPHWSSYFISVVPIEMLYLEPKEAEQLLRDPDPEFTLSYDTGIVETVLQLTHYQPYLLQLLGAAMVTQANLNQTDIITPKLLETAIKEALTWGEPYFTNIWTEFTGESEADILVGQQLLFDLGQGKQPPRERDEITETVLKYMIRHHILRLIDHQYCFEIPLVERWVQERAVL
ncbi:MAG: hypothetical protein AB4058_17845 [Microcystaceae cyanobacterium]